MGIPKEIQKILKVEFSYDSSKHIDFGLCCWFGCDEPYPRKYFVIQNDLLRGSRYGTDHSHDWSLIVRAIELAKKHGEDSASNILLNLIAGTYTEE